MPFDNIPGRKATHANIIAEAPKYCPPIYKRQTFTTIEFADIKSYTV